jgi:hypothetical protein
MNLRDYLALLGLLVLASGTRADPSSGGAPVQVNVGAKVGVGVGAKDTVRGWYLFWPADALTKPRMPLPYPWWPQQPAAAEAAPPTLNLPAPGPELPPSALQLPRDNAKPPVPGATSWAPGNPANPFQPVSYPVYVPGYWWHE